MLDDDVIEHRCPDLVVPQQRVETVDASMTAKPRSRDGKMLRRHTILTQKPKYHNKTDACRDLLVANVRAFLRNLHSALKESLNKQHRKEIHGNIRDYHKWTEEHTTIQTRPFGTFALVSHFLTLA